MIQAESGQPVPAEDFCEWLVTNSLGSFAMGTPQRLPERKYHGLLMAKSPVFADPHAVLNEINEVLLLPEGGVELAAFHYGKSIHPQGFQHLTGFEMDPQPQWKYQIGDIRVKRSLRLHPRRNSVILDYEIEGAPKGSELLLYPYFSCRRVHDLASENALLDGRHRQKGTRLFFKFYKAFPEVFVDCPQGRFELSGFWNQNIHYPEEERRGYEQKEDVFCPGAFRIGVAEQPRVSLVAGLVEDGPGSPILPKIPAKSQGRGIKKRLEHAAESFLIEPEKGRTSIVAGYPWFGEWGRDTFIALPGLVLARGEHQRAYEILKHYASHLKEGLVPNVLGRNPEESDGNSIDASLWFIRAMQMLEATAGPECVQDLAPVLFELLETILKGKRRGIHVRPSGLLYTSAFPRPLTWMDAMVDQLAVTPRSPFAVDVNALFHNGICYALTWAKRLDRSDFSAIWTPLRDKLADTFREAFWLEEEGYLADAHDGLEPDPSFRPNQLLALALPHPLLAKAEGAQVLAAVRKRLLTPFGLRTLDPDDPAYRGTCVGTQPERDAAYHQGTVWPWLLGMFWDAVAYVEGAAAANKEAKRLLKPFVKHLEQGCLGQVSEIFDGDAPHKPRGAPAQAWSVAELLRIASGLSQSKGVGKPAPKA